jgi:Uma2 family endonuclease
MRQTVERLGWTVADLELLPQNEGTYYEVIEGELFVTRLPHRRHQQVGGNIYQELNIWSQASGLGEAIPSPGIIFSEADSVIPDVVWVSKERLAEIEDEAGHLNAAPELMVEVLSPGQKNIERDRLVKLQLYSRTGVQEYWIVDRFSQQVEVYRRRGERLILAVTLSGNDELTSPLLPGFRCAISHFFG